MTTQTELLSGNELKEVLALSYRHLGVFAKTFLPDAFDRPFAILHEQILHAIDAGYKKIAIAAPRNLGKTTIARALCIRSILYRDYEFITYNSQSEAAAMMQTENVKRELRTNKDIKKLFGDIKIDVDDPELDESFSKHSWVAFGNTLVMPRGMGQQVRGLIFKNARPGLLIVDDLEDRAELENPENRRKTKEWFHADLEKSVDRYSDCWRIFYIDTLKHSDSLLQELLDSDDWYSLRLDLCDDNYNSLVPDLISTEELKKEVESHRAKGMLDIFYMEYRNLPVSKEDMSFGNFKYYNEEDIHSNTGIENFVIVDPAKKPQIQSADSAIVGIGVDYKTGSIYFRDCVHGKMYPDQIYEEIFSMRRRLNAHYVGIEVTGLEEFIKQPIMNEMLKRGPRDAFEPVWLIARGGDPGGEKGKIKRIGGLVPYYRQGYIYHNKACCATLEGQLLAFPRSALLDVADAFAYIIEMLEMGGRYFEHPEPENDEEMYRELDDIDYEPELPGWRHH